MTADLDTLLRDAGRDPTRDLDVDAVHARGRRRAVARRAGAGAGAVVVIAVVGLGVVTIADRPETPIVDQAPTVTPTPAGPAPSPEVATPDASPSGEVSLPSVQLRDLGPAVALLRTSSDGAGGLHVLRADDAGTVTATYGTAAGAAPPNWARIVVDAEGRVVFVDETTDGSQTLLAFPIGEASPVVQRGPAHNFSGVLGHDADGLAVVGTRVENGRHVLLRVGETDLEELRLPEQVSLRDVGEAESYLVAAAAVGDDLLLVRGEGDGSRLERLTDDGAEVVLSIGPETWLGDVAVLGGDVWLLEGSMTHGPDGPTDPTFDLLVVDLDTGTVLRLPTPVGRGIDGAVLSLSAAETALGPRLLLSMGGPDGAVLAPLVVDTVAARTHLHDGGHTAEPDVVEDVYARLAEPDAGDGIRGWGRLVSVP